MNQLKALFLFILLACSLNITAQRIKGSDTVLPVSQETAEIFMKDDPDRRVTVTGGGTGVGISALMDNTTDIAMASRPIKFSEKMKLKAAKQEVEEVIIAYDASSGTYEFFKESALKNKNYMSSSLSMPATGAVIQSVSQTKGAIGYVGLAYLSPRVKAIAVSYDDGKHYVLPSLENGKKKLYPVVRPLYYYYNVANKEKVTPFIDYILSPQGQNIIKNGGYIPVK